MPKVVYHDDRREEIAKATWNVIRRDGLEKASIRNIASEANMSPGSIRHYFASQTELLSFSMMLVSKRVEGRLRGADFSCDALSSIEMIVEELVPIDDERFAESQVWLSFTGRAISDPTIQSLNQEVHDSISQIFRLILTKMNDRHLLRDAVNPEMEALRFHALVDGLATHGVTRSEKVTSEMIRKVISYHLNEISRK